MSCSPKTSLAGLSFDCLTIICDLARHDTVNLIMCGDRLLQAKLRSLKSLEVKLGMNGGYVRFEPLYAVLEYLPSIKTLSVASSSVQQIWLKKLKSSRLPSSLESLRLDFWRAVTTYLARPSFYASLPRLRCLELSQFPHATQRSEKLEHLTFKAIPSALREIRILKAGKQSALDTGELQHLSSELEVFEFDGVMYDRPGTPVNWRRFPSLRILRMSTTVHLRASATDFSSNLTDLHIDTTAGFNIEESTFLWHVAFPSLARLYFAATPFKWRWLLDMPYSVRSIQAKFESFGQLPVTDQQDILLTLASQNDNFAKLDGRHKPKLLVPSQLNDIKAVASEAVPNDILRLFTGVRCININCRDSSPNASAYDDTDDLKGTILNTESAAAIKEELTRPRPRELTVMDMSRHGVQLGIDPITRKPRKFATTLTDFSWTFTQALLNATLLQHLIPSQLAYALRTLTCNFADDVHGAFHLSRFPQLNSLIVFSSERQPRQHGPARMTSSRLTGLLPPSVTNLVIDRIIFDSPLALPHLRNLVLLTPLDITNIPLLPTGLRILSFILQAPIDVSNKTHCDALLSFPRSLVGIVIIMDRSATLAASYGVENLDGMGMVFTKQSLQQSLSRRVDDQCHALELLTRNLKCLVDLHVPVIALPDLESMILPQPQTFLAYFYVRIPFLHLLMHPPELLGGRSNPIQGSVYIRQMVSTLAPTSISAVKLTTVDTSGKHQARFDEMFMESRGHVVPERLADVKRRKIENASEHPLFWFAVLVYHFTMILIAGLSASWLREEAYEPYAYHALLNFDFSHVTMEPHTWLPIAWVVYRDANLISSLIGLPNAIGQLRRKTSSKWSFFQLTVPLHRIGMYFTLVLASFLPCIWLSYHTLNWLFLPCALISEILFFIALERSSCPSPI